MRQEYRKIFELETITIPGCILRLPIVTRFLLIVTRFLLICPHFAAYSVHLPEWGEDCVRTQPAYSSPLHEKYVGLLADLCLPNTEVDGKRIVSEVESQSVCLKHRVTLKPNQAGDQYSVWLRKRQEILGSTIKSLFFCKNCLLRD